MMLNYQQLSDDATALESEVRFNDENDVRRRQESSTNDYYEDDNQHRFVFPGQPAGPQQQPLPPQYQSIHALDFSTVARTELRIGRGYDFSTIHHPSNNSRQNERLVTRQQSHQSISCRKETQQRRPSQEFSNFTMGVGFEQESHTFSSESDKDEEACDSDLFHDEALFRTDGRDHLSLSSSSSSSCLEQTDSSSTEQKHQNSIQNALYPHSRLTFQRMSSQRQPVVLVAGGSAQLNSCQEEWKVEREPHVSGRYCSFRSRAFACCFLGLVILGSFFGVMYWAENELGFSFFQDDPSNQNSLSMVPTASPPTLDPLGVTIWQQYQGEKGSGFGSTVLLNENWVAMGAPGIDSVSSFYQRPDGYWDQIPDITVPEKQSGNLESTTSFGSAIDFVLNKSQYAAPFLLVGAPDTPDGGSAFLYNFVDSSQKRWQLLGEPLAPVGESVDIRNSKFGAAVAMSDNLRVVVGAPQFGADNRGRIFTFQFSPSHDDDSDIDSHQQSTLIPSASILGSAPAAGCGSDLDLTRDGQTLVVGEPNQNSFMIYDWVDQDNQWVESFRYQAPMEYADIGTSVVFLSSTFVAVGAPSANQNSGLVSLFEKNEQMNAWTFVKSLFGKKGDYLGARGNVNGAQGSWGTQLLVSTMNGLVQRYDLEAVDNSSYMFVERFTVNIASATSIDIEADEDGFVVVAGYGGADLVLLYGPPYEAMPSHVDVYNPPSSPDSVKQLRGELVGASKVSSCGYGTAVALAGDLVVVGQPLKAEGAGSAELLRATTEWTNVNTIVDTGTEEFGSALAFRFISGKGNLLVGAKSTRRELSSGLANYGSAHYFELDESSNEWIHIGKPLQPESQLAEAGGEFGAAVALSSNGAVRRVAIGAPSSSMNTFNQDNGRVYTFEYDGANWRSLAPALIGKSGSFFGSAVDMTNDSSRLLVGAPGGDKAVYYNWVEEASSWNEIFVAQGQEGEAFGSSAAILADNGSVIAVGGHAFGNGRGVIRVYSQSSPTGPFQQLGNDIKGNDGERIGATLCGAEGMVVFGTDQGYLRVYSLVDGQWQQKALGGFVGASVVSIAMSECARTVVVGLANEEVWIYDTS